VLAIRERGKEGEGPATGKKTAENDGKGTSRFIGKLVRFFEAEHEVNPDYVPRPGRETCGHLAVDATGGGAGAGMAASDPRV